MSAPQSVTQLGIPFLENGLHSTNFFNGRLLSGEAMTAEQDAVVQRARRLGKAVGSGIAYGLEVQLKKPPVNATPDQLANPILTVAAGLAINRCGQPVKLVDSLDVTLVRPRTGTNPTTSRTFQCCQPPKAGGRLAGEGVYLFTIAPASGREGRAAVNGVSSESARCNSNYLVEGVQFNLIPIAEPFLTADDFSTDKLPLLRNRVAYKCFGIDELTNLLQDAFGAEVRKARLTDDLLARKALSDSEVPLAILYWTASNGVGFVDLWAVRRRLTQPQVTGESFPSVTDRRRNEAVAMFLQFQDQITEMAASGFSVLRTTGSQYFSFLPPVGALPAIGMTLQGAQKPPGFFAGFTIRGPHYMERDRVGRLLQESLAYPPIRAGSKEFISVYVVRASMRAGTVMEPLPVAPVLIFASGYLPPAGLAQFDLSRWGGSNFV